MRVGLRPFLSSAFVITLIASGGWAQAPLTVAEDGTLLKHGVAYRAIGVNVADAFWRALADPANTSYEESFAALARRSIPFARIAACPYWPKDYAFYRESPNDYFARMDGVVRSAEKHGIGLVLSLHWATFAVPDVVGEPVSAWGKADSETIAFMRAYTQTLVERYRDSPAVWIWELGNEYSLAADIDPLPPVQPALGTPASRSEADRLNTSDLIVAWTEFGKAVRAIDAVRPITTGNSLPRPPSEALRAIRTWSPLDTHAQMQDNLLLTTPDPVNVISVHIYRDDVTAPRFAPDHLATYGELVASCAEAARTAHKALFIGEFGASGSDAEAREQFGAMIDAILESNVVLAAVWNFDWRLGGGTQDEWTITETNARSFVLDAIERANAELSQKLK